jgi:hypothetical protein
MARKIFLQAAVVGLLALFILLPSLLLAQGNTWAGVSLAQVVEAARWRIGDFRANIALALANVGYDTDIYFGYLDRAAPDYAASISLPTQILLPLGKKVVLDIFDSPQRDSYLYAKKERAWNNTFRGQIHFALSRFYIQMGAGLSNLRQRLSPELNINIREKEARLNGTMLWQTSQETSFAFLYGTSRYNYGEAEYGGVTIAEALNRREESFDIVTYFQPSSIIRLFLDGQYGTYRFEEVISSYKDTRSYGVLGGLTFVPRKAKERPKAPIQGNISLGYKRFDILEPLLVDGSGFVAAVEVSAGLFKRTLGRVYLSRDFEFSASSAGTFYLSTTFGGGISRQLSRHAIFMYDLYFGRSDYPKVEGGGATVGQNFRYTTHSFNVTIRLARNLMVTFLGVLSNRAMEESGVSRNRNFFGLSMVYGYSAGSILAPVKGLSR